ncbi:MAG: histidine phosphatase family protein [Anaerolineae bacterium]|nr:histidine phosphatase family protein [Anaerolineae bacterium]
MKRLLLMRHAKSSWKETEVPDIERPLKKRGTKDAEKMGKLLRNKKLVPDLIISSTAERAVKTAEIVAQASKYEHEIIFSESLYMAEPSAILKAVKEHGKKKKTVMVIGHNPGLEAFLQILTGKVESLPTASIAYLAAKLENWDDLGDDKEVKLKNLWIPKD